MTAEEWANYSLKRVKQRQEGKIYGFPLSKGDAEAYKRMIYRRMMNASPTK